MGWGCRLLQQNRARPVRLTLSQCHGLAALVHWLLASVSGIYLLERRPGMRRLDDLDGLDAEVVQARRLIDRAQGADDAPPPMLLAQARAAPVQTCAHDGLRGRLSKRCDKP